MAAKKSQLPPTRRQTWLADLNPTVGSEQRETRPVVVVSNDTYNKNAMELIIVLPLTTTDFGLPYHIEIDDPKKSGVKEKCYIMCDQIRCISQKRLIEHWGYVTRETMGQVETTVKTILDFDLP